MAMITNYDLHTPKVYYEMLQFYFATLELFDWPT